jgi:hypothetical protein
MCRGGGRAAVKCRVFVCVLLICICISELVEFCSECAVVVVYKYVSNAGAGGKSGGFGQR